MHAHPTSNAPIYRAGSATPPDLHPHLGVWPNGPQGTGAGLRLRVRGLRRSAGHQWLPGWALLLWQGKVLFAGVPSAPRPWVLHRRMPSSLSHQILSLHTPKHTSTCHRTYATDGPPIRPNISLGDSLAGLHAAFGAVMALLHRDRARGPGGACAGPGTPSGSGQVVDVAISESIFNMMEGAVPEWFTHRAIRPPSGTTLTNVVPSGAWQAQDGKYVIIGGNGNSGESGWGGIALRCECQCAGAGCCCGGPT